METEILIDGKLVKFRATAAVPRLYRIKFRRDILQDMVTVKKSLEDKERDGTNIPLEALNLFENMAYIMAKHADKDSVPENPSDWLEEFGAFSIYKIFPVLLALWEGNIETMDVAKKKLGQQIEKRQLLYLCFGLFS